MTLQKLRNPTDLHLLSFQFGFSGTHILIILQPHWDLDVVAHSFPLIILPLLSPLFTFPGIDSTVHHFGSFKKSSTLSPLSTHYTNLGNPQPSINPTLTSGPLLKQLIVAGGGPHNTDCLHLNSLTTDRYGEEVPLMTELNGLVSYHPFKTYLVGGHLLPWKNPADL